MFRRGAPLDYFSDPSFDPVNIPISSKYTFFHNLLNPCRVACHLIRLGHEPLPPKGSSTFLHLIGVIRRPLVFYPNAFTYSFYLLKTYGYWQVLTCGFFSSFCLDITHETVAFMNNRYLVQRLLDSLEWMDDEDVLSNDQSTLLMQLIGKASPREFSHLVRYFLLTRAYEVFVTQPFFGSYCVPILIYRFNSDYDTSNCGSNKWRGRILLVFSGCVVHIQRKRFSRILFCKFEVCFIY